MSKDNNLDPDLVDFLAIVNQMPPMETMPIKTAREMMAAGQVDKQAPSELNIKELTIDTPQGSIAARLYTPELVQQTVGPGLVFFHGGGFILGSLDSHDAACRRLSHAGGFRLLSVDYRLAPEHPIPAGHDDAENSVVWAFEHADELGFDRTAIAVGGDSAGAALAAWVAVRFRGNADIQLRSQILIYPPVIFKGTTPSRTELAQGYIITTEAGKYFNQCLLGSHGSIDDPRLNLMDADLQGLPPTYLVTAGFDPLRDEGHLYAGQLIKAGNTVLAKTYSGFCHGFINMAHRSPAVATAVEEMGITIGRCLS